MEATTVPVCTLGYPKAPWGYQCVLRTTQATLRHNEGYHHVLRSPQATLRHHGGYQYILRATLATLRDSGG